MTTLFSLMGIPEPDTRCPNCRDGAEVGKVDVNFGKLADEYGAACIEYGVFFEQRRTQDVIDKRKARMDAARQRLLGAIAEVRR